jgi:hypothetical protein
MDIKTLLRTQLKLSDNPIIAAQPSVEDIIHAHYEHIGGRIVSDLYVQKLIEASKAETQSIPDDAAKPFEAPKDEPVREQAKPASEKPEPAAEKPREAPKPERPKAPELSETLQKLGIDLKVGGVDFIGSIEKSASTGNPSQLLAAIGGVLLGAIAQSGAKD